MNFQRSSFYWSVFLPLFLLSLFCHPLSTRADNVVDGVAASVDGTPIMLSELSARAKSKVTLAALKSNAALQQMLDIIIFEKALDAEVSERKITVAPEELAGYVAEVARRNSMSTAEFKAALLAQGKTWDEYEKFIRYEILKGKLTQAIFKSGISLSEDDVTKAIENESLASSGSPSIVLSQIFLLKSENSSYSPQEKLEGLKKRALAGEDFAALAHEFSEAAEAKSGGSLGSLEEKNLSKPIREAVQKLSAGQLSTIVETAEGFHLFRVDSRLDGTATDPALREQVRRRLLDKKIEERAGGLTNEILKRRAVEKLF